MYINIYVEGLCVCDLTCSISLIIVLYSLANGFYKVHEILLFAD